MCVALSTSLVRSTRSTPLPAATTLPLRTCHKDQKDRSHRQQKQIAHHHLQVIHHYHDHSMDDPPKYQLHDCCAMMETKEEVQGITQHHHPAHTPFPMKLHEFLSKVEVEGVDHIISWQPHGRCFVVHKPVLFKAVLPRYFALSKVSSFQRQLNLYGFQRITRGRDKGGYYHELFLRHMEFLSDSIRRVKVKGTGVRARSNPEQEPDFWCMPWVVAKDHCHNNNNHTPTTTVTAPEPKGKRPPPASPRSVVPASNPTLSQSENPIPPVISFTFISDDDDISTTSSHADSYHPLNGDENSDDGDDDIVTTWGMPFHYLKTDFVGPTSIGVPPMTLSLPLDYERSPINVAPVSPRESYFLPSPPNLDASFDVVTNHDSEFFDLLLANNYYQ